MDARTTFGLLDPCGGGDPIPLTREKLLIGRRKSCDIALRFSNVSSHHCELELVNGFWVVRDLGSRNGVKVNGERVESKYLMPGDVISVARHRFELSYTPGDGEMPEDENPFARSLMEKAGLATERRPKQKTDPAGQPVVETPRIQPQNEDDFYLEWLSDG